jgi:hypothetical protein
VGLILGDRGCAGEVASLWGICSDRPLRGNSARWGVTGVETDDEDALRLLSSLDVRLAASIMCGDGDRSLDGVPPPSDMDRVLDKGDRRVFLVATAAPAGASSSAFSSIAAAMSSSKDRLPSSLGCSIVQNDMIARLF